MQGLSAGKKSALTKLRRSATYQEMTPGQKAAATRRLLRDKRSPEANLTSGKKSALTKLRASVAYRAMSPGEKAVATKRIIYGVAGLSEISKKAAKTRSSR